MKFRKVTLGEISINNRGYYGIGASAVDFDVKLPTYLRISDINDDGSLNKNDLKSIKDKNYEKYLLRENDIVFARTGNSTGRNYFYEKKDGEFVFAGFLIKFSLNQKLVYPKYIKYVCQADKYWAWVNSVATGSTRKNINAKMYEDMPIELPEYKIQKQIVNVLEVFDKKIEVNNKIIENLEAQAQAIFKSWFVDFEPFADGDFVESELGLIPKGWEVKDAKSLMNFETGSEPGSKNYTDNKNTNIPFYRVGEMLSKTEIYVKEENLKGKIASEEDVLVSFDGTVGRVVTGLFGGYSSGIKKIMPKEESITNNLIYVLFKSDLIQNIINQHAEGTTILHASKSINYMYLPYNREIYFKFSKAIDPLIEYIRVLKNQNNKLASIRDTLLPKLMAGEIDIANISIED